LIFALYILVIMPAAHSAFDSFYTALQNKLQVSFHEERCMGDIRLLWTDELPIRILYYPCGAAKRLPNTKGGRNIHLDEDQWIRRAGLILNRIAALAGRAQRIHARKTVAARIDKPAAMAFQQEHHLQVALPGKYRYGLFHGGVLVSVAIFSGGRKMEAKPAPYRSYELLRFCHKQGIHVVGGFSKLIKTFQQDFHPGDIMTYADKDWSDGSSYRKMGFVAVGETEPQCFWINTRTMERYYEHTLPLEIRAKSADERHRSGFVPLYNNGSIKLVKT